MNEQEYDRLSRLEFHHWWYRTVHRIVVEEIIKGRSLYDTRTVLSKPFHILDAGCGTGGLTEKLERFGSVVGIDISPRALDFSRNKKAFFVQGSVNRLPFRDHSCDAVTSISVLYHNAVDDQFALAEMGRVLKPGGFAIIVVPAFRWLWGRHDVAVHTQKRYSMSDISTIIQRAGFTISKRRYLFSLLFPLFVLKRLSERFFPTGETLSDLVELPSWLNRIIGMILWVEWKVGRIFSLPFGSSILVVARS